MTHVMFVPMTHSDLGLFNNALQALDYVHVHVPHAHTHAYNDTCLGLRCVLLFVYSLLVLISTFIVAHEFILELS